MKIVRLSKEVLFHYLGDGEILSQVNTQGIKPEWELDMIERNCGGLDLYFDDGKEEWEEFEIVAEVK